MTANLVSQIMQFITPSMTSKIASSLNVDPADAQKAIGAGVPAILASFAGMASKPGGGQQLSNALAQQTGSLDQLKNAIGGGGEQALAQNGTDMLSSLLGGGALDSFSGIISRFAGIDANTSKSLLGMLSPVVAGVVGQQQRSAGLDANGLASLLSSQKDHIAAALPSGLASQLGASDLLDSLGGTLRSGAATASAAAGRVSDISDYATASAGEMAQAARGASSSSWPYWAAGLALLAGLGWFFAGHRDNPTVADRTPAVVSGRASASPSDFRSPDLAVALTSSVGSIRSALEGITDPASAQAALPKLQQATTEINNISSAASQLAPDARKGISSVVASSMPMLNQLWNRVLATPQTSKLIKPTIDDMRAKLEALSRV